MEIQFSACLVYVIILEIICRRYGYDRSNQGGIPLMHRGSTPSEKADPNHGP